MKIAYYMPFKPLGHPNPSGDLILGTEIFNHLHQAGHACQLASRLRCRWIYLKPQTLLHLAWERHRVLHRLKKDPPHIWLSYHCYYKAPDLLGPWCAERLAIPYVVFQGVYSTKRRRQLLTRPGFVLNRQALLAASMVFTNKRRDEKNLLRLLPADRVRYIAPGLHSSDFTFDPIARTDNRRNWRIDRETVIMTAAMLRPGVKTDGVKMVIERCAELLAKTMPIRLVIVGDGKCRDEILAYGRQRLGDAVIFCGRVPREQLAGIYSGADIFAFPGFSESLGMVYLEAQSCGLPVVACRDWGGGEAVVDGVTGLLAPADDPDMFLRHLARLVQDGELRRKLGDQAASHIRNSHELSSNYLNFTGILAQLARKR